MSSLGLPEADDDYWYRSLARAWQKVAVKESGCWEWTARLNAFGYGTFKYKDKSILAHRFFYALDKELVPGLTIDHKCNNRACVNPQHLDQVTQAENFARVDTSKLGSHERSRTHCPQGHEYTLENTYVGTNKRGGKFRNCRTCHRERERARRRHRK